MFAVKLTVAALAFCCALAACTQASPPEGAGSTPAKSETSATGRGKQARVLDPPRAQMQVGTTYARGSLVRACGPARCEDGSARAPRALRLKDQRLVLFVLERVPRAAAVEVRKAGTQKVVARKTLRPSATMAYVPKLRSARYDVLLDGEWKGMRARWRFALTVS